MRLAYGQVASGAALSVVLCAVLLSTGPLPVIADMLVAGEQVSGTAVLRDLQERHGSVSGVLENTSQRPLRDVRLLVRHTWLWKSERAPQHDNPGRAVYYAVPDEVPPGGTVSFTYKPDPPLPVRADGHFETAVEVVGFTQVGE